MGIPLKKVNKDGERHVFREHANC